MRKTLESYDAQHCVKNVKFNNIKVNGKNINIKKDILYK